MLNECQACGYLAHTYDGLCSLCEESYYSGLEEGSVTRQAMASRRFPADMSDPWDMVGA